MSSNLYLNSCVQVLSSAWGIVKIYKIKVTSYSIEYSVWKQNCFLYISTFLHLIFLNEENFFKLGINFGCFVQKLVFLNVTLPIFGEKC